MKGVSNSAGSRRLPPLQQNFEDAVVRGLAAVRAQPVEQLAWLGARRAGERWALAVLDDVLSLDLADGTVRTSDGRITGPWWQILTLHYLSATSRPGERPPEVTFASLPEGRGYASVYQQRVIERLCRTVGLDGETLAQAGRELGGTAVPGGDAGFDFQVYPRIRLRLIWYAGDEELPPSAVMLLPENVQAFLPVEDIVVLSERIVSRLSGGRF